MAVAIDSENVAFESAGLTLRGELLLPAGAGPHPAIVVTHGFGFVKDIFTDHNYPQAFRDGGYAVLVYDHCNTGISDGEPRQELDPIAQQRGYQDAITYLCSRDDIDSDRIGIWGTSYSGGHVLGLASQDRRVKCVVSQVMTISGHVNLERRNTPEQFNDLHRRWAADRLARFNGAAPQMINQIDRTVATEQQSQGAQFISSLPAHCLEHFDDRVTLRTFELYNGYEPAATIERISPTPLLMIVCDHDTTTFTDLCLDAYERARQPKQLIVLDGDHFDAYRKHFDQTSSAAVNWFGTYISARE